MRRWADPLPRHDLEVPDPEVLPFAIGTFDRIGPLAHADFAHRHTFYEIDFVTGGHGAHVVDLAERALCPPHLCFVTPGQIHYWRASGLRGHVVLCTDDFLLAHPGDREALHLLAALPWRRLDPAEAGRIRWLIRQMERERHAREAGFATALQSYLHLLIVEAGRLHRGRPPGGGEPAASLVRRFRELLADEDFGEWTVAAYAARLGVSASALNETVRQAMGATPGQVIRRLRTLEAKRLLAGAELSVTQVARRLGFADPAYFCRFFRRETGRTPGGFRDGVREKHQHPGV
ncbi:helix-turn-helix domain-containing protein [Actinoplanes oblitus]|uniref:Helix-turn-helix domain-containing protein n=1 Tax=Actinoplanes oblitus TaxID=3040509 RepID=A0ABY8WKE5_9ACTN|nr:helix-turn-helix domain-containing protein [Actinoplanes oblitus]WIM97332.1 helix-turn-helix domain-containing protein [Actinoplanes oblitus]